MYQAPEVQRGEPFTVQSDLYSLGMVARELVTGHLASDPSHLDEDEHHDLPPGWFALLTRATADDPDERFETVGDFLDALHGVTGRPARVAARHDQPAPGRPRTSSFTGSRDPA